MKRILLLAFISFLCAEARAQTLADLARQQRERRKTAESKVTLVSDQTKPPAPVKEVDAEPAPQKQDATVRYYEITGSSPSELRDSMNRQRPAGKDGQSYDGETTWDVRWQYTTADPGGNCTVSSFDVSLDLITVLPRWVNPAGASSELAHQWTSYLDALSTHERVHKEFGLACAEAVRAVRDKVGPQPNCALVQRAMDTALKTVLDEYRAKDRQYDQDTGHGRTQGARFPF